MDSPSRSRKRGSQDQLHNQDVFSQPENIKRSKNSLESILEKFPEVIVLDDDPDSAPYVPDYGVDLHKQQNKQMSTIYRPTRREGEELPSTVTQESIVKQDPQNPVNGNTGQGPVTNNRDTLANPIWTRQLDQGTAHAGGLNRPVIREPHDSPHDTVGQGADHASQDYQRQLKLVAQQNEKRLMTERQTQQSQETIMWMIASLPDELNVAHKAVKALSENIPVYIEAIKILKQSVPVDIKALQGYERDFNNKEVEIKALESRYNELIRMTPGAQQEELRQVKDRAMLTVQQEWEALRLKRDDIIREIEEKNERIAGSERGLERATQVMPDLIQDLIQLEPKLQNARMISSSARPRTIAGDYIGG